MYNLDKQTVMSVISGLNMENSVICLHSSLKSFGSTDVTPDTIIDAFLGSGCTIVVPTFTYGCAAPPPEGVRYEQNAYDYENTPDPDKSESYDINSSMIVKNMGAIPSRLLQYSGRVRGNHPQNSFAAVGPKSEDIISSQTPLNVYGPFKKAYEEKRAFIVLAGVNLTKATPIHYAEEKSGRRLFRRWGKSLDNSCIEMEVGSCSEGFEKFTPLLTDIERKITVGASEWRVFPFAPFIDIVTEAIRKDQGITHCDNRACMRCSDATKGGPILK